MTKPALIRPRTFELILGLVVVVAMAGMVISRNGPRTTSANQSSSGALHFPLSSATDPAPISARKDETALRNRSKDAADEQPSRDRTSG